MTPPQTDTLSPETEAEKFTPGPWHWANGKMLLYYTINDDGVHCENDADARLIAAAPDLYEALKRAVAIMDNCIPNDFPKWKQEARAALRSASGDQT